MGTAQLKVLPCKTYSILHDTCQLGYSILQYATDNDHCSKALYEILNKLPSLPLTTYFSIWSLNK